MLTMVNLAFSVPSGFEHLEPSQVPNEPPLRWPIQ
jgi:hypothetical protein